MNNYLEFSNINAELFSKGRSCFTVDIPTTPKVKEAEENATVRISGPSFRPDEAVTPEVERAVRPKTLAAVTSSGTRSRPERNRMIHRPLMNSSGIDGTTLEPKSTLGAAKISPIEVV